MDKHIVKDIHILKLNILGCDNVRPLGLILLLLALRQVVTSTFSKHGALEVVDKNLV
jgi:hypothetical protein